MLQHKFTSLSAFFRSRFFISAFIGISSLLVNSYAQTPDVTILELNKPIERELSGTAKPRYQIALTANQYLRLSIEQRGIDLGARLYSPENKVISDFDVEFRLNGVELIEFVAPSDGSYSFEIVNKFPLSPPGKYEIRLEKLDTASDKEKKQQEARTFHADSIRFFNAGKYAEARKAVEKAIEINKIELGTENLTFALNLTQLARIIDAQSEYAEAEKINQQALQIFGKIFEADHPHTANTLNYIATNFNHSEDYPKAIEYHQRALAMRERIYAGRHPAVAASLINLGVVFSALGDKTKAIEFYTRASEIQEKTVGMENFNAAVVLNNIGEIYNGLDEYKKAQPFLLRAVQILEKIYKPDNPRIFDVLTNLAYCYAGIGDLVKSEELYLRILAFREKSVGGNHPLTAHAAYNLGNLYALKGDVENAERQYRRALEIRESKFGTESLAVSEVLSALALLLAKKGDIDQSLKLQERSDQIDELNAGINLAIGSERQKLAYLENFYDRINQSIFIQTKFAASSQLAATLGITTVLRNKGRVLDAVAGNREELRRRSNPEDKKLLDSLDKVTKEISELILNGADETPISEHQRKIKSLSDEREKLEDEISRGASGFFARSTPVTLEAVKAAIPKDFALIEFAIYSPDSSVILNSRSHEKRRYIAYVIKNEGEVKWKDLGEKKEIDDAIINWRKALRDPKRGDVKQLARSVDEKIMQPLRDLLGEAKNVFVSPDGELNLIPFEALVDEENRYLVEEFSFIYLTSGRDLLRLKSPRESKSEGVIIANPEFGEPAAEQLAKLEPLRNARKNGQSITATRSITDTYFAPLGATIQEGRSIQTLFPATKFLSGDAATETAVKQTVAPKILHIATHGFFLESEERQKIENPLLRSGLALAGANQQNKQGEDGIFTALEATGLNLWGTKLVVLSACDTGLGEVKNGEGVYGLRRAFFIAGSESLVMSFWAVSDVVTRELMTSYYKNLKDGKGRNASLRSVQLEMLKKDNRKHPFYWASFIQSGDWGNLEGKK